MESPEELAARLAAQNAGPVGLPTLGPNARLALFARMPVFDVRNGQPADARSIFIRPSIPAHYHWVVVGGVPPEDALSCIDAFIRSASEQLALSAEPGRTATQSRKVAICLGSARAAMTAYFRLVPNDMIQGEVVPPMLTGVRAADGTYSFAPLATLDAGMRGRLTEAWNYTDQEVAVIPTLVACALGILPLQGYSLAMTQHHYLSDPNGQSRRAYAAVEKQFWHDRTIEDWFTTDLELIQDALWHKSGHPVSLTLKENMAYDQRVADMLVNAGVGSAAARLPAVETDARAANSFRTLFSTCKPLFEICDGGIDFSLLDIALDTLKAFPVGGGVIARPATLAPEVPASVRSRETARAWLKAVVERNASNAALCFGFYCTLTEQAQVMSGAVGTDTLKSAFSLKKLRSSSHAAYIQGVTLYADYTAARAASRAKGDYLAPKIVIE